MTLFRRLADGVRGTTARMPSASNRPPRVLFTVRPGERFPEDLWHRFRAIVTAKGESWIDVLRGLIEAYVHDHDKAK